MINLSDVDSDPDGVRVSVVSAKGVRLENPEHQSIVEFSQRDFLNHRVSSQCFLFYRKESFSIWSA